MPRLPPKAPRCWPWRPSSPGPGSVRARTSSPSTPTKALPEIWTEQAKFKEHADKLQADTQKLAAAAKTNSVDNLKAAFGPVAQTCKACHDAYQKD